MHISKDNTKFKYSNRIEIKGLKDVLDTSIKAGNKDKANEMALELIEKYIVLSGNVLVKYFSELSTEIQIKIIDKAPLINEQILDHVEKKSKYYLNVEKILVRQRKVDSLDLLKDVLLLSDRNLTQLVCDVIETILVNFKQSWIFRLQEIQNLIYSKNQDFEKARKALYTLESLAEMVIQTIESVIFIVPIKVPAEAFLTMLFLGPNRYSDIPFEVLFDEDDPEVRFLTDFASWRILSEALIDGDKKVSFCTREAIANNETIETPEFLMYCLQHKNERMRSIALNIFDNLKSTHSLKGVMKLRNKRSPNSWKKLIESTQTIPYISLCINNVEFMSKNLAYELLKEADIIQDTHRRNLIYAQLLNFDDLEYIDELLKRFKRTASDQSFDFLYNSLLIQIMNTQLHVGKLLLDSSLNTSQKHKVLHRMLKSNFEEVRLIAKNQLDETTWKDLLGNVKTEIISLLKLETEKFAQQNSDFIRKLKSKLTSENTGEIIEGIQLIDCNKEYSTELFPYIHKLVRSNNSDVRSAAVRVLNKIDPKTTNDLIITTLNDDSSVNIKLSTLKIVEELNDKRYVVYLKQLFTANDPSVKAKAIYLVFKLSNNELTVLPEIEKMLRSPNLDEVKEALSVVRVFDKDTIINLLESMICIHTNQRIKTKIIRSLKTLREY
ncbi:MAG: HEAT repeat domain-containing protein [Planctomycetes bacterium]|nr:HEAT repeat domain-containing protein [Planctomycetota bacterium]